MEERKLKPYEVIKIVDWVTTGIASFQVITQIEKKFVKFTLTGGNGAVILSVDDAKSLLTNMHHQNISYIAMHPVTSTSFTPDELIGEYDSLSLNF
jgi:hypothetical protein